MKPETTVISAPKALSYRGILKQAWPIILANAAVPLLGLVDTAIIGQEGDAASLSAIALGSLVLNFLYWSFGFLRMSTTGFIAHAFGSQNQRETQAVVIRGASTGLILGCMMIALQSLVVFTARTLLDGSETAVDLAMEYITIRIWGAPATLIFYVITGSLIGLGQSKKLLAVQIFLNGLNIILDLLFAGWLQGGVKGLAYGTLIAEWLALGYGLYHIRPLLGPILWSKLKPLLQQRSRWLEVFKANTDIMIRTWALLFGFFWFTNQAAGLGDSYLAAQHLLLQIIAFSAFFLDGFAFVAESHVGQALGQGKALHFRLAIQRTSVVAIGCGFMLGLLSYLTGPWIIDMLSSAQDVRAIASSHLIYCASYIALSAGAFQLDGVFIGACATRALRNSSILAVFAFLGLWSFGGFTDSPEGLWFCFICYVVFRAMALALAFPSTFRHRFVA